MIRSCKFFRVLFSWLWLTTHARQLKIVGGALQASLAWAETSAMSAQLQELQHEIVSPKQSHSGSRAIQLGFKRHGCCLQARNDVVKRQVFNALRQAGPEQDGR